jgi:hypothetical protein
MVKHLRMHPESEEILENPQLGEVLSLIEQV